MKAVIVSFVGLIAIVLGFSVYQAAFPIPPDQLQEGHFGAIVKKEKSGGIYFIELDYTYVKYGAISGLEHDIKANNCKLKVGKTYIFSATYNERTSEIDCVNAAEPPPSFIPERTEI